LRAPLKETILMPGQEILLSSEFSGASQEVS